MQRPAPPFTGYSSAVVAFTVLLAGTAAAALLLSPGPDRARTGPGPADPGRSRAELLAIPVIPYALLWQEKLASDLFGQAGRASGRGAP